MNNLKKLVQSTSKKVYVYLSDIETSLNFMREAENEGFIFSDGCNPTEKKPSDLFALYNDMTISYIGIIGRIAYQCNAENILKIDYKMFINDNEGEHNEK